jgi:hypothetical protein
MRLCSNPWSSLLISFNKCLMYIIILGHGSLDMVLEKVALLVRSIKVAKAVNIKEGVE